MKYKKPTYEELERQVEQLKAEVPGLSCKNEKALSGEKSLVQSINDNLYNGMVYQVVRLDDGSRKFTCLSDKTMDFYGITPREGMKDASLIYGRVHKDDINRVIGEEEEALATMSIFQTEARIINPEGEIRWSYFVSHPNKKEDGLVYWDGIEFDISERKKAEDALLTSEKLFRDVFERSIVGKALATPDGKLLKVNRAFADMLGYTVDELQQYDHLKITHPEDADKSRANVQRLVVDEIDFYRIDKRYPHKNGETVWVDLHTSMLRDNDGKALHMLATIVDITERKEAEEKMKESENELAKAKDFLNSVVDAIPLPLAVKDANHRWRLINKVISDMFGKPKEEMLGKTDHDIIKKEEADIFRAVEEEVFRTGIPNINEEKVTEKDGRERWQITTKSLFRTAEGEKLLLAIANDITMRKRVEQQLRAAEETYRNVFLNAQIGMFRTDIETGLIIDANDAVARFVGFRDREEMLAAPFNIADRYANPEDREKMLDLLRENGVFTNFEAPFRRNDGSTLLMRFSARMVADFAEITTDEQVQSIEKTANAHILVIDDNEDYIQMIKEMLESEGFKVTTVLSGKEAVDYFRDGISELDIVLLDMLMPEMHATEVFFALKELNPSVKVILCSGYSKEGDASMLLENGAEAFLQKPFDVSEAVEVINRILQEKDKKT